MVSHGKRPPTRHITPRGLCGKPRLGPVLYPTASSIFVEFSQNVAAGRKKYVSHCALKVLSALD